MMLCVGVCVCMTFLQMYITQVFQTSFKRAVLEHLVSIIIYYTGTPSIIYYIIWIYIASCQVPSNRTTTFTIDSGCWCVSVISLCLNYFIQPLTQPTNTLHVSTSLWLSTMQNVILTINANAAVQVFSARSYNAFSSSCSSNVNEGTPASALEGIGTAPQPAQSKMLHMAVWC